MIKATNNFNLVYFLGLDISLILESMLSVIDYLFSSKKLVFSDSSFCSVSSSITDFISEVSNSKSFLKFDKLCFNLFSPIVCLLFINFLFSFG